VLLTGDIEADAERLMLKDQSDKLPSDVLLVPHHGSDTSSTGAFIRTVNPKLALVSAGYGNRYGFPTPSVLARYRRLKIPIADTAAQGALSLDVHPVTGIALHTGYRQANKRYWTTTP
jgi:competence protein ComEC